MQKGDCMNTLLVRIVLAAALVCGISVSALAGVVLENEHGKVYEETVTLGGVSVDADWYIPSQPAIGFTYMVHGFGFGILGREMMREVSLEYMKQGIVVLAPTIDASGGNETLAYAVANQLIDNPPVSPEGPIPNAVVISGHSAGGLHASLVVKQMLLRGSNKIRGAVLFDPVDSGNKFEGAVDVIVNHPELPVLSIVANGGVCNLWNNTEDDIERMPRAYVGIKLLDRSSHMDVVGNDSTGVLGAIFCGGPIPSSENVARNYAFSSHWAYDMLTGAYTSDYYPFGGVLSTLLNDGKASLLKDYVIPGC